MNVQKNYDQTLYSDQTLLMIKYAHTYIDSQETYRQSFIYSNHSGENGDMIHP